MHKHKAPAVTLLGIAAAITVVVLVSVDSEGRPGTAQASDGNVDVAVGSLFFGTTGSSAWNGTGNPGTFEETTIHVGDSVTWTPWSFTHSVAGCDPNTAWLNCPALFDCSSGAAPIGNSGCIAGPSYGPITFSTAGEYPYLCTLHPSFMRGKIVVLAVPMPPPPVGGIADFPDVEGRAPAGTKLSEGSSFPYATLVGGLVAVVALAVAGGWYALRRWPR